MRGASIKLSIALVAGAALPLHAMAQIANTDWGGCSISQPPFPIPITDPPPADGELEILSGAAEVLLDGTANFSDDIVLRSGDRYLTASDATYDFDTEQVKVSGDVEYRDAETRLVGDGASFDRKDRSASFDGAEFQIWSIPARGSADSVAVAGNGDLEMRNVTYTSCPEGKDDWLLRARKIEVDQETGYGTARDAKFEVKGVPVMYLPYFTYPVSNRRKSGLLAPDIGSSGQRGFDLTVPWYWNIAPNLDATLRPRLMSRRGVQMGTEFRYLTARHSGVLDAEFLGSDDVAGTDRSLLKYRQQSYLPLGWRADIDFANASDSEYFEDFGQGLDETSQTHLPRILEAQFFNGPWSARFLIENYQTIDPNILRVDRPYARLPEIAVTGMDPDGLFGLSYEIEAGATYFERNLGVTGARAHITPTVSLPIDWFIFRLTPSASLDHTRYALSNTAAGQEDAPTRTLPLLSVDLQTSFERYFSESDLVVTLEPRLFYTYIPFRDQDNLPVFDTIEPDLNIIQLFRTNRFIGRDRIADTNQVSIGLTSRILDSESGTERLRLTMGQLQYLSTQDVTLPGDSPDTRNSSDYIAELSARISRNWAVSGAFQWDNDQSETQRTQATVTYQKDARSLVSLGYRFRRDSFDEADIAVAWPLTERWNFVGRYNYSLESKNPLEQFAAMEYETCCWAIRGTWRRTVVRRNGEADTSFGFQIILKGFGDPGTAAADLLNRGILSY